MAKEGLARVPEQQPSADAKRGDGLRVIQGGKSQEKEGFTASEQAFFDSASEVHGTNVTTGRETREQIEENFFKQEERKPLNVDAKAVLGSQKVRGQVRQEDRNPFRDNFFGNATGAGKYATAAEANAATTAGMSVEGAFMKRTAEVDKAEKTAEANAPMQDKRSFWRALKDKFSKKEV